MQKVYGYVRVSTTKQGDGVSLDAQKESIERYAKANDLLIIEWFEEKQTAAKIGREKFDQMLKQIGQKKANGIIFHKVDRSTRNHSDWSKLIDLRDLHNISLHFSNEGIDMNSRGGRLIADIMMSISKGYIDNLREEVKKGLYGRLNQGIYPFLAPRGYVDTGGGNVKEIDPKIAPLIKEVFELYATGKYSLDNVANRLAKKGLVSSVGNPIGKNVLSRILHNPFYIGLMKVKGETYVGKHQPIISNKIFQRVQKILSGKVVKKTMNNYKYRTVLKCSCGRSLVGEKQKKWIYYRCHSKVCPEKTIREDRVNYSIEKFFKNIAVEKEVEELIESNISKDFNSKNDTGKKALISVQLRLTSTEHRIAKLTDLLIDGMIENDLYKQKKEQLLLEQTNLKEQQKNLISGLNSGNEQNTQKTLELSQSLYQLYLKADKYEKRSLLKKTCSNLYLKSGTLVIEPKLPFILLLNSTTVPLCGQESYTQWDKKEKFSRKEIKEIADAFIKYAITKC